MINGQYTVRLGFILLMASTAMKNQGYLSRGDLLDWVNSLIGTQYQKVEQLGNGAAFCQILDALYPGTVRLKRVDFNAVTEPEMIANYKVLQEVFTKKKIDRNVEVEKLVKCHAMASLEMLQWMKGFFEHNFSGGEYDGPGRRAEVGIREPGDTTRGAKKPTGTTKKPATARVSAAPPATVRKSTAQPTNTTTTTVRRAPPQSTLKQAPPQTVARTSRVSRLPGQTPKPDDAEMRKLKKQLEDVKRELDEMKKENQTLLEERNFYLDKLQQVEALCTPKEEEAFAASILEVLYATDEEHGFVAPDELDL